MDEKNIIPEAPKGQPADPVQMALTGKWTLEVAGDDWGARATVYAPSPSAVGRKCVAVGLPQPVAEKLVRAVNAHDSLVTALTSLADVVEAEHYPDGNGATDGEISEALYAARATLEALVQEAKGVAANG